MNIRTTPAVNKEIRQLLTKYTYAIMRIENNKPVISGVNNLNTFHYTEHYIENMIVNVNNKDISELFNSSIISHKDIVNY
jgi:hypothetical protein